MAGRRVALKAIDWVAFAERVPPNQRGMFNALKTRSDAISAKLVICQLQALESHENHLRSTIVYYHRDFILHL